MRRIFALVIVASLPLAAPGAEISLRRQATPGGSVVRLGDIADLSAKEAGAVEELAAISLMPTPAPGTQQYLGAAQLRDLLAANGVDVSQLTFRGASTVAIGSPAIDAAPVDAPPGNPTRSDGQAVAEHVAAAIIKYLREQTGHELWDVKVDAEPDVVAMYWRIGPHLTVTGGREPWTGRQGFQIGGDAAADGVRAYAKVQRLEMIAFAVRPINAGDFVRATDVALRPYAGVASSQAIRSLEAVIGKEAIQAIRSGAMLNASQVRAPLLVRRGERVSVQARAAGIVVRTYATAQQNGAFGDLIQVQALEGKDRYAARVAGLRELEVFAAGASAGEIAAAAR